MLQKKGHFDYETTRVWSFVVRVQGVTQFGHDVDHRTTFVVRFFLKIIYLISHYVTKLFAVKRFYWKCIYYFEAV